MLLLKVYPKCTTTEQRGEVNELVLQIFNRTFFADTYNYIMRANGRNE